MLYCLDTNIIIDFFENEKEIVKNMQELEQQQVSFSITPIILCELYKGAYLGPKQNARLELINALLKRANVLQFTNQASNIYGQKYSELKKKGKQTQEADLMIAAITIAHNAVLITRNIKHFKNIKELKVISW